MVLSLNFKGLWCRERSYLCNNASYQEAIESPLPDSTQWKLIDEGYAKLKPIFLAMEKVAAQGSLFSYDDTRLKILSVIKHNKENPGNKRTGQFTSVILAETISGTITLFYSSTKHAGENMQALINQRSQSAEKFITMSDALAANTITHENAIEANCLAHAIVKFIDLDAVSPYDLSKPIDDFTKVFEFDEFTRNMSPDDRLAYHQEHSKPILDNLHNWMIEQMEQNKVEPNSHLGRVIKYCLKHWVKLTRFLNVAGCPVSNNISERALKLIIRIRKASMFHKTEHGAEVCATLLSIIQTAIDNDVNPIEYLTDLLTYSDQIIKEPEQWLPWHYKASITDYKEAA